MRVVAWSAPAAAVVAAGVLLTAAPAVVLADVTKAAAKHKLVKYTLSETSTNKPTEGAAAIVLTGTATSVCYADLRAPRFRTERAKVATMNGAAEFTNYQVTDRAKGRHLSVSSTAATAKAADPGLPQHVKDWLKATPLPERTALVTATKADRPGTILDELRRYEQHEDAAASDDTLGGRAVRKFVIEDGKATTTLWVDARTKLPVRTEMEVIDPSPACAKVRFTSSDFQWDPPLPAGVASAAALFDVTPPAGYAVTDQTGGAGKAEKGKK